MKHLGFAMLFAALTLLAIAAAAAIGFGLIWVWVALFGIHEALGWLYALFGLLTILYLIIIPPDA